MSIYIVQHGISLSKDKDPQRGLSEIGITNVKRIAEVAKNYEIKVSGIYHSGKLRALQTAEIFDKALNPAQGIKQISGISPMDDVKPLAQQINSENNIMYVGHLPFMERFISFLITGDINIPVFKLQNGGILCMDLDLENKNWHIKWGLMPNIS